MKLDRINDSYTNNELLITALRPLLAVDVKSCITKIKFR